MFKVTIVCSGFNNVVTLEFSAEQLKDFLAGYQFAKPLQTMTIERI